MAAAGEVQSATGGRRPDIDIEGGWFLLPADVQTCIADGKSRTQKPLVMEGVMEGQVLGWWLMEYSPGCAVVRLERKEGKRKQGGRDAPFCSSREQGPPTTDHHNTNVMLATARHNTTSQSGAKDIGMPTRKLSDRD